MNFLLQYFQYYFICWIRVYNTYCSISLVHYGGYERERVRSITLVIEYRSMIWEWSSTRCEFEYLPMIRFIQWMMQAYANNLLLYSFNQLMIWFHSIYPGREINIYWRKYQSYYVKCECLIHACYALFALSIQLKWKAIFNIADWSMLFLSRPNFCVVKQPTEHIVY